MQPQTTLNEKIVYAKHLQQPETFKETINLTPCEYCPDIMNFNKCDPTTCNKLENLAINLGVKR